MNNKAFELIHYAMNEIVSSCVYISETSWTYYVLNDKEKKALVKIYDELKQMDIDNELKKCFNLIKYVISKMENTPCDDSLLHWHEFYFANEIEELDEILLLKEERFVNE